MKKVELEAQRAKGTGEAKNGRRRRNPVEDLKREVAIMRTLRHKNIVSLQVSLSHTGCSTYLAIGEQHALRTHTKRDVHMCMHSHMCMTGPTAAPAFGMSAEKPHIYASVPYHLVLGVLDHELVKVMQEHLHRFE